MQRTRIKFCGITREEDAVAAAEAGADAIGLVFCEGSARRVSVEAAARIAGVLPPFVTPVGLFVDTPVERIREIAGRLHLRHLQLHGKETPAMVAELGEFVVIKAVPVRAGCLGSDVRNWGRAIREFRLTHLRGLLLETASEQAGGSGIENDWGAIETAQRAGDFEGGLAVIAAGGLTAENVGGVVRRLRPWAVDTSSGIESGKGIKSVEKMKRFVAEVRGGDEGR